MSDADLIEKLAELSHNQWAGWTDWMFEKWDQTHASGETFQQRWMRQVNSRYADLSEQEKESDRVEARKTLALLVENGWGPRQEGLDARNRSQDAHDRTLERFERCAAERDRLRAALAHYADEENWIEPDEYHGRRLYVGAGVTAGCEEARTALTDEAGEQRRTS